MSRHVSILALILLLLPLITPLTQIPLVTGQGGARITVGVSLKAGTYNFYNTTPTDQTVVIMDNGLLRIIINRTEASELGDMVRISLIRNTTAQPYQDLVNPNLGGHFLNISNIGVYGPSDPSQSPYGGVIDITKNGSKIKNEYGVVCGNVTLIGSNIVIILIDFSKLDSLENVTYITNVYDGSHIYLNLYNQPLRVKVYDVGSWDAVISYNVLRIIHIPIECSDVYINVDGYPAKYGDIVNITVSLEKFFEKIETHAGVPLDIMTTNLTNLTMINYYNVSEEYYIASFVNGLVDFDGSPAFIPINLEIINSSTFRYDGMVTDFAPTQDVPGSMRLASLYMFKVIFRHEIANETMNLTFTIISNSTCASTSTTPYLWIDASMEVYPLEVAGDPGHINPGDYLGFYAHNVPDDYLDTTYWADIFNLENDTYHVVFSLYTFLYIYYYSDGTIEGMVELPELPYAGLNYTTFLVFSNGKWIMDGEFKIDPYIVTYVFTNSSAYAEDVDGYYIGNFVSGTITAPGDYIVIEGHGFNLTNMSNIKVWMAGMELQILDISTIHTIPSQGKIYLLAKLLDGSGNPVPTGIEDIYVGTPGTLNVANKTLNVTTGEPVKMVLFNPIWFLNDTGYFINHTKLGDPYQYFIVEYPLINDTFTTVNWPLPTWIEIMGWTTDPFVLKLYNKMFDITYDWLSIDLDYGYGVEVLNGKTIPFLAYGNYTLLEETLASVNNRTVFTVHMGIDVDASPCRNGTFDVTIVGGAPNTEYNLTFNYNIYELMYNISLITPPQWAGDFVVTVVTNASGYGYTSIPLSDIYTTDMVTNATWDVIIRLGLNGTGTLDLWFKWNGSMTNIVDNLTTPITYVYGPSDTDYETYFYVHANYNVTVTTVTIAYIDRKNFTIAVPETVLPGDKIIVQIYPHKTAVWDLLVDTPYLYEESELIGWYLDVRLVDPMKNYPNNIVDRVAGYYAGKLVREDVDGDTNPEIWFVANLTAPFILGVDKTYRVDVYLFLAVLNPSTNVTGLNAIDNGCNITVDINGTIYWNGYKSYVMVGGDHQIVTVLGILEAKLDRIINDIAVLEAKLDDLTTYIKVNITNLLLQINDTVASIKNDTVVIKKDLATIKMNITTLIMLTTWINNNVTTILTCCRDVENILNRMESTINSTHTYVLWINGNLTRLVNTVDNEVVPKFYELYNNLTIYINTVENHIIQNITVVNNSLSLLIITTKNELKNMVNNSLNTILNKIDDVNRTLTLKIDDAVARLCAKIANESNNIELLINLTRDELNNTIYNLFNELVNKIDTYYNNLDNKITDLKLYIENATLWITSNITDVNASLHTYINISISRVLTELAWINMSVAEIIYKIDNEVIPKLYELNNNLTAYINITGNKIIQKIEAVNTSITTNIELAKNETLTLINNVLNTLMNKINASETRIIARINESEYNITTLIKNKASEIKAYIVNVNTTMTQYYNDLKTFVNTTFTTLSNKLDNCCRDLKNAIADLKFYVGNATIWITSNITDVNASLHTYIDLALDNVTSQFIDLRNYLNTTFTMLFNDLDTKYGDLKYLINASTDRLEGTIYDVSDDVLTNITIQIDSTRTELKNLINLRVDELKYMINDNVTTILATIRNVNLTIINKLNEVEILINNKTATILTRIAQLETDLTTLLNTIHNSIMTNINNTRIELVTLINNTRDNLTTRINNLENSLTTLMLKINNTLTLYIKGRLDDIKTVLDNLRTYVGDEFTDMKNTLNGFKKNMTDFMTDMNKTLVNILTTKLDSTKKTVEDKLSAMSASLSDKIDTASKRQEDMVSGVGSNLTLFGASILLLEVVIIALIGYSLIARRPVG